MPSSSKKQHNFMAAIAHSPSFAKKVGVSQSVGKDFNAADKGKTFNKGGMMKESKAMVGKDMMSMKKKKEMGMAPRGMTPSMTPPVAPSMAPSMASQSPMGMNKGGMPMKDGKPAFMKKFAKGGGIESRGKTKGTIIRMASGGSVSSASRRADGIAQRGKTRC